MENLFEQDKFIISNGLFSKVSKEQIEMHTNPKGANKIVFSTTPWEELVPIYPFYRIYYVVDGEATFYLNDHSSIVLQKDKLYFFPAFSIQSVKFHNIFTHYSLHFKADDLLNNSLEKFATHKCINARGHEIYIIEDIIKNFRENTPYSNTVSQLALKYLLTLFINEKQPIRKATKFDNIVQYINDHICEKLSITALCNKIHLSPNYFTESFRKKIGYSPIKYINLKKIELAKTLLYEGKMNISQISDYLGFDSPYYFSKVFKNFTGTSPMRYKKLSENDDLR